MTSQKMTPALECSPIMGSALARITWGVPPGHGCDDPEHLVNVIETAIRNGLCG